MISTSGLPANLALKFIDRERVKFESAIQKNVVNAREIAAFRERVGKIETVDQLVNDYEVYAFVMKAFDLEDQMFGKAMMKKILAADPKDKTSLVSKMTDNRFKSLNAAMGFTENGKKNENTIDPEWVESMVLRYTEQKLINSQTDSNELVGTVLHMRQKASTLSNWYAVLGDKKMQSFFYTAFGLPDGMAGTDIDRQVATLEKKFDLKTLNDPGVLEKLTLRYLAIGEAKAAQASLSSNPILQLFSSGSGTQQSITQINLSGLSQLKAGRY
jgi:hypothetical protein